MACPRLLSALPQKTRQAVSHDFLRFLYYVLNYFFDAFDGIDQAGVLAERKRGVIYIASGTGR